MEPGRLLLIRVVVAVLMLAVIELLCFGFIHFFLAPSYPHFFADNYDDYVENIDQSYIDQFRQRLYDPELGWNWRPGAKKHNDGWSFSIDEHGLRTNNYPSDRTLISSFGDSFTFGDEVNDDQTWQVHLSKLTNTRVLNYGVGGYGLDQSLLKLRRELERGLDTPFVVMSTVPDVTRLLSRYRAFYNIGTGIRLGFKPMLLESERGYRWLPNPLARLDSRADVEAALETAKEHDYWYHSRTLRDAFPYTLDTARFGLMVAGVLDIPRQDQWGNRDAVGRLRYVIDEFVTLVTSHGLTPVFMFIPHAADLRDKDRGKRPDTRLFLDSIRAQYAQTPLLVVDVLEREFVTEKFTVRSYDGHASGYGNEQVAAALFEVLQPQLPK